jgi:hypothetical protein
VRRKEKGPERTVSEASNKGVSIEKDFLLSFKE